MAIHDISAIDVHCHYGLDRSPGVLGGFCSGDEHVIKRRMAAANICCSIVSPLAAFFPRGEGDPLSGNDSAEQACASNAGLLQWAVVDPLKPETYEQAERLLKNGNCMGIKIHPEEHVYSIGEHGDKLFSFAARLGAVVQAHSGEQNSDPMDFVEYADAYPEAKLILSHIGCGWDGDATKQVRAIQASKNGNIYADTSSAKSIIPGLIEWAVREAGSSRILFGSDSPLYFAPMQRARIDFAEMEDEDKLNILYRTALNVFGGKLAKFYTSNSV